MTFSWFSVANIISIYVKPIGFSVIVLVVTISLYVTAWNIVITYNLVPASTNPNSGMITTTVTKLTTSSYNVTGSTTTSTTSTIYNETLTATICPTGATSCTGTSESVAVVVNRPLIPGFYFFTIPVYDSAWNPPSLLFYHNVSFTAMFIVCALWTTLNILDKRRKINAPQVQRRLRN